jgi:hypothetical protein
MAKQKTKTVKQIQNMERSNGDVVVQLATRIPKTLARELKLHSVTVGISIADLVGRYIKDGMAREGGTVKQKKAS